MAKNPRCPQDEPGTDGAKEPRCTGRSDEAAARRQLTRGEPRGGTGRSMAEDPRPAAQVDEDLPDDYINLNELAAPSPILSEELHRRYRLPSLESQRTRELEIEQAWRPPEPEVPEVEKAERASRLATKVYTHCYLVIFSILGTLARLGLQSLTTYPGAPVGFASVWPNFAGSLIMGFLAEDRMLFRDGCAMQDSYAADTEEEDASRVNSAAARRAHKEFKKTIPLYIGLATGFCGSLTSFSAFMRDSFLALSNDLEFQGYGVPMRRSGGESFMALLSVIITSVSLSLGGLFVGSHLATALEPTTPSLPHRFTRYYLDRVAIPVGIAMWLAAVFLTVFPPNDSWRGQVLFALVFSPLGCLARFYLSLLLNGKITSFPLGTFTANVLGTGVLGMCWDLAHLPAGGLLGCQVLSGMQDGFCGCLTTVSTWVLELATLRKTHAYMYGAASMLVSLVMLIATMGGLRWSRGFMEPMC